MVGDESRQHCCHYATINLIQKVGRLESSAYVILFSLLHVCLSVSKVRARKVTRASFKMSSYILNNNSAHTFVVMCRARIIGRSNTIY